MIIHIFADTPHHYLPMLQFYRNTCAVAENQHQFWAKSSVQSLAQNNTDDIIYYKNAAQLLDLLASQPKQSKLILHGVFDVHIWRKLLFTHWLPKAICILWGAELYRHNRNANSWKEYAANIIHKAFLRRCSKVCALNQGDADIAANKLGLKQVKVLPYPIIGIDYTAFAEVEIDNNKQQFTLLIGNSASIANEHAAILNSIAKLQQRERLAIKVVAPLNYAGTPEYVSSIVALGKKLFGDNFLPITKMLDKQAYDELLMSVDSAIFAHQRQQGLYVAYAMLLQGKPMFMRSTVSSYASLSGQGFELQQFEQLESFSAIRFSQLHNKKHTANTQLMLQHYTEYALAPKWLTLFSELESYDVS